jgi:hypothetical protein
VEALDDDERRSLVHHLPAALGVLFALPEPSPPAAHRPSSRPAGHPRTVAEGHTGSNRPLSESAPERAHAHSVAKNPNPHADTKVSSSEGPTQEREDETLASGRPARRPLSEG